MSRPAMIPDHATFVDDTEVELVGPNGAPSFLVEVEFEEIRSNGAREITDIRPYEWARKDGVMQTRRVYLDCPRWLTDLLKDAIEVEALRADWSDL